MSAKVSVIVPVYNAEWTLAACLGNLVHQTLTDIELILVNDASTDSSLQILLDCEAAFPDKVMLINLEENTGAGGARNVGLCYASGEYIGFVDSDDLADPTMYETLYQIAKSGDYDMVDCAYYNEESDTLILQTPDNCNGVLDNAKRDRLISGGGYLWSRLFRRELLEGLHFREHAILEDMETLMALFMKTKKLGTCSKPLYKYSASPSSASKPKNPRYYHQAITEAMNAVYDTLFQHPAYSEVQRSTEYSILHLYQCGIVNALHPDSNLPVPIQNSLLKELFTLRHKMVKLDYKKNPYVKEKFSKDDIELMISIDKRFS